MNTEVLSFLRNTLNYNNYANIGEPQIRIPETNKYQEVIPNTLVRIPANDYTMTHADLINFLGGHSGLPGMDIEIYERIEIDLIFWTFVDTILLTNFSVNIPALPISVFDLVGGMPNPISTFPVYNDFSNTAPIRAYIIGPQDDGIAYNDFAGNYWLHRDSFPFNGGIHWNKLFLHSNGSLNEWAPDSVETEKTYTHDPDNPAYTIGGHNMLVETPAGEESRGQMNLASADNAPHTLTHPGVIQFETDWLDDTVSVIGYPQAKLFASSLPQGANSGDPTDTDFIVRIVDVYPTGEEYYVVEGVVNARARHYAKSIAEGNENNNAPFENIDVGEVYEFHFEMLPIGYTFGKGHKMKVLISSSNHPKYQSNPNIPLEDGEFFRRAVGESTSYNFQGQDYFARTADNSVHFAPNHPSYVTFPVFGKQLIICESSDSLWSDSIQPFSAQLHWNPVAGSASYILEIQEAGSTNWDTMIVYGTSVIVDSLNQETDYNWRVTSDCGNNVTSGTETFTTDEFCASPDAVQTLFISDSSAVLTWNSVDYAPGYTVYFGLESDSSISYYVTDTFLIFNDLLPDTSYEWYVETDCDVYELYSDTLLFATLPLPPPNDTTSISLLYAGDLLVYPNPFEDEVYIRNQSKENLYVDILIIDINGRTVKTFENEVILSGYTTSFNTSHLVGGYYYIQFKSYDSFINLPLIKIK